MVRLDRNACCKATNLSANFFQIEKVIKSHAKICSDAVMFLPSDGGLSREEFRLGPDNAKFYPLAFLQPKATTQPRTGKTDIFQLALFLTDCDGQSDAAEDMRPSIPLRTKGKLVGVGKEMCGNAVVFREAVRINRCHASLRLPCRRRFPFGPPRWSAETTTSAERRKHAAVTLSRISDPNLEKLTIAGGKSDTHNLDTAPLYFIADLREP
jgi:hypothetical protein